jgi:Fe(3+) dicitrate transport protein
MNRTQQRTMRSAAAGTLACWWMYYANDALAFAQESEPAEEVRVVGARPSGGVTIVTAKDVERMQPFDVAEALRRVPSLYVRQDTNGGQRLDIGVRGLDPGRSRRVLVLEDGVPIQINPYAEPDLYYATPIERVAAIEVVKGSASILYGPQTLGGVVNFRTLLPPAEDRVVADMLLGNFGTVRARASYGSQLLEGRLRYVMQAFHRRNEGPRGEDYRGLDAMGKVEFDGSARSTWALKLAFHTDDSKSDDVGLTQAMFERTPSRGILSEANQVSLQRYDLSLRNTWRITEGSAGQWSLQTQAYAYQTDRFWRREDYARTPNPSERYTRVIGDVTRPLGALYFRDKSTLLNRGYRVLGVESQISGQFATGPLRHHVRAGGRLLLEGSRQDQRVGATAIAESGQLFQDDESDTAAFAGYLHDQMRLQDLIEVQGGFRVEHARYQRATLLGGNPIRGENAVTGIIPGVGAVLGKPIFALFGGVHLGFAPPRVSNAISPRGESTLLDAEQSTQFEFGVRSVRTNHWTLDSTLFVARYSNQVVSSGSGTEATAQVNGGTTEARGVESALSFAIGRVLRLPVELDASARLGLLTTRFRHGANEGNQLPYAPNQTGGVALDVAHRQSGLSAQVNISYTGSVFSDVQNTLEGDVTGRQGRIPGYAQVDANVGYQHAASGLSVRVLGKNLGNHLVIQSRRPEGIFVTGFRQLLLQIGWTYPAKRLAP